MDPVRALVRFGHVAHRQQLLGTGVTPAALARALQSGRVDRIRRGWFADAAATAEQRIAVRIGGRLGGTSALRAAGVWTPRSNAVCLSMPRNASRLRPSPVSGRPLVIAWTGAPWNVASPRPAWTESVPVALAQAARVLPGDELVAVLDSALHLRRVTRVDAARVVSGCRTDVRPDELDGRSEAGTESLTRFRLRRAGVPCRIQQRIPGVGRADIAIGDRLLIEVDGAEFHAGVEAFARDRRRDLDLAALGYRVIRLSYVQVVDDWPATLAAILAVIDRGEHLTSPALPFSGRMRR